MSGLSDLSLATDPAVSEHLASSVAPSAFGDDFRRFVNLTWTLAITDFKLRYFGSVLGYVWSLMRPLLFFGVLYVVFTQVFNLGGSVYGYPVYLLTGIIFWTFFFEATTGSVTCLMSREGLLRKMRFPRLVIPVAVVLTAMLNLATNLVAVLVFALASGIFRGPRGLRCPCSSWRSRSSRWASGWSCRFCTCASGTSNQSGMSRHRPCSTRHRSSGRCRSSAPSQHFLRHVVVSNPLGAIQVQMYKAFINPAAPSALEAIGGWLRLLVPIGVVVIVFVLGVWLFNREAPRIAENL